MLQTLNRYAVIGSALALLICFWNSNALPRAIAFQPALRDSPRQHKIEKPAFSVNYGGVEYRVEPKYDYELYGMVVSYRQHDGKNLMHRSTNDHLNMADVCADWSDTAFSAYLHKLKFWNGIFLCNVETSDEVT
jgi:hypothetical protein